MDKAAISWRSGTTAGRAVSLRVRDDMAAKVVIVLRRRASTHLSRSRKGGLQEVAVAVVIVVVVVGLVMIARWGRSERASGVEKMVEKFRSRDSGTCFERVVEHWRAEVMQERERIDIVLMLRERLICKPGALTSGLGGG
jgi:hypothetical protein